MLKLLTAVLLLAPQAALAADLDGRTLGAAWALPFVGILLSIALFPLLAPHAWEHHQGKIAAFWAALVLVPLALLKGLPAAVGASLHVALLEYVPFILLLFALFTIAGGIRIKGNLHGSPLTNATLLLIGAGLASVIGTTGASMVMIRPVMRANDNRRYNVHVIVFFIFLVSNIGGALTPLGDPPLFLGFLRGVDFFWTTRHLLAETLFVGGVVLAVFVVLDTILYRRERDYFRPLPDPTPDNPRIQVTGGANFALIGVVIAAILFSASWKPGVTFSIGGVPIELQNAVRDIVFVAAALASLALTSPEDREANGFSWGPIAEVAKLFAGIFLCMVPVLAMLRAGLEGPFAQLVALVSNPDGSANTAAYFWLTGALSSFLDNAPTYLVFFELAGGEPRSLMTTGALTLAAISSGAVYMGANSYIGNAPNFMVYAIAKDGGVKMPSFFGYMLWSGAVLVPTFVLATFVFFRG
ncbi:sodium:proton antiporter [Salinarimonas soli]|uniref:Sodium:proton antiporter n=1 Tax=Salinarimonas soli TaxID=1638099 RepID=A0A5B2VGY0_9HYPH|nr:sodium:proton antiporter [Salinarimonas soli]KAA2237878.1 sodium:proton antiporter [Salinarimonas soli]